MRALLNVPDSAAAGEIVQVKVLIRHPMETGFRTGRDGRRVPRDIIHELVCDYDGAEVFRAELFPAVAANPFFSFHLRARRTGEVVVRWTDEQGTEHREARTLIVA